MHPNSFTSVFLRLKLKSLNIGSLPQANSLESELLYHIQALQKISPDYDFIFEYIAETSKNPIKQ